MSSEPVAERQPNRSAVDGGPTRASRGTEGADVGFQAFATRWRPRVEESLERWLPDAEAEGDGAAGQLAQAMRYSVFAGGKRLRPMLVLLGAEAAGGDADGALSAAAALEMLHTYSLVHDDLPCMDDDDLRRGRPTCHKVYGDATAVLAGDALLTLAFEAVAADAGDRAGAAVVALARAAGAAGMVGGQALDLAAEGAGAQAVGVAFHVPGSDAAVAVGTVEHLQAIHDRKTGALIRASLEVGALAGGGRRECLLHLRRFGDLIGRAFQIADDVLDVTGTAEALGKQPGQDEAAGKLTYPAVIGVDAARHRARALADEAIALAPEIVAVGANMASHETNESVDGLVRLLQDVAAYSVARSN